MRCLCGGIRKLQNCNLSPGSALVVCRHGVHSPHDHTLLLSPALTALLATPRVNQVSLVMSRVKLGKVPEDVIDHDAWASDPGTESSQVPSHQTQRVILAVLCQAVLDRAEPPASARCRFVPAW